MNYPGEILPPLGLAVAGVSHVRGGNPSSEMASAPGPPLPGIPVTCRDAEESHEGNQSLVQ